jgi:carboxyl-terminal processing protease
MKRIFAIFFVIIISSYLLAQNTQFDSTQIVFAELAPEPHHRNVSQLVSHILMRSHYQKKPINDSLSSDIFDLYINTLDYNRLYFLESDLKTLEAYRYMFDDYVLSGQIEEPYQVFNLYEKRAAERLEYVFKILETDFDFTIDEYLELDRENASRAKTKAELDDLWRKRLKHEALNLKLTGKDWDGVVKTLKNRYKRIRRNLTQYNSEDVFQLVMNSLAESYDPHTNYFSPKDFDDFKIRMSQSLEGIGARLSTESDYTKVVEIVPGGPADKSKQLFPNDKITGVGQGLNGEILDVIGWRIDDVVQLIRGKKSTLVRLQVLRADSAPEALPDTIALVRDKIKLEDQSAKADTLQFFQNGRKRVFGVINIPSFYSDFEARRNGEEDYKSTSRDVEKLIRELETRNVEGLVIDLRGNGGGFLNEAVDLSGLFIDKGPVVQVRDTQGKTGVEWDTEPGRVYDGPLIVLVDRLSASASEIFAAAIQDYERGIIIGSQSFGKGTVQNAYDLNRYLRDPSNQFGQLKLTVAKFYRINGGSTQHVGVVPDISFPSRFDLMEIGESTRKNALLWDQINPVKYDKEGSLSNVLPSLEQRLKARLADNSDYMDLLADLEKLEERRQKTLVSLQESKRRAEREKTEEEETADIQRSGTAADSSDIALAHESFNQKGLKKDLLLKESAFILNDFIDLSEKR